MVNGVFITGTDTDVGKTIVSSALIRFLRDCEYRAVGVKPVCCGGREDIEQLSAASDRVIDEETINPLYFDEPAAPYSIDGSQAPLCEVIKTVRSLEASFQPLVVEGAGGWCVPVTSEWGMDDLAQELSYPVILVIGNRLGAINHTLLTVRAIESAGLDLAGFFLNTTRESEYVHALETNRAVIESLIDAPCLGDIPHGGGGLPSKLLCDRLGILREEKLPDLAFTIPLR